MNLNLRIPDAKESKHLKVKTTIEDTPPGSENPRNN